MDPIITYVAKLGINLQSNVVPPMKDLSMLLQLQTKTVGFSSFSIQLFYEKFKLLLRKIALNGLLWEHDLFTTS